MTLLGNETDAPARTARVLTVPNLLTSARVVLIVWFLLELLKDGERVLAAGLLAIAGTTDFLDGYIARRFHQESTLGKILDPAVDRVLLISAVAALLDYGAIPVWLVVVVLGREALVSAAVLGMAFVGAKRIDVLFIGKAGTFGLMVALPLLLAGDARGGVERAVRLLGWLVAYPSIVLSMIAALVYVPHARSALSHRRRAVADQPSS